MFNRIWRGSNLEDDCLRDSNTRIYEECILEGNKIFWNWYENFFR